MTESPIGADQIRAAAISAAVDLLDVSGAERADAIQRLRSILLLFDVGHKERPSPSMVLEAAEQLAATFRQAQEHVDMLYLAHATADGFEAALAERVQLLIRRISERGFGGSPIEVPFSEAGQEMAARARAIEAAVAEFKIAGGAGSRSGVDHRERQLIGGLGELWISVTGDRPRYSRGGEPDESGAKAKRLFVQFVQTFWPAVDPSSKPPGETAIGAAWRVHEALNPIWRSALD